MQTKEIKNLEELKKKLFCFFQAFKIPQLILLEGPLAVGKSQMVYFMCRALGVFKQEFSSPTFSLINVYESGDKGPVYHIDFFRLKEEKELETTAFWDIFYSPSIVFIEWPELVKGKLPLMWNKLYIELSFSKNKESRILKWQFKSD